MECDIELLKLTKTDKINIHARVRIFAIPRVTEWLIRDSLSPNGSLTLGKLCMFMRTCLEAGRWSFLSLPARFSQIDFINTCNIDI